MKLNFWQWIGILVFVIAAIFVIRREMAPSTPASNPAPATTQR
jgi:drug/metabolite transporter (DMT)-like permease